MDVSWRKRSGGAVEDYGAMVAGKLDEASIFAYNELASYLGIAYSIIDTVVQTVKITTTSPVTGPPKALTLGSVVMMLAKLALTFPYDKKSAGREWR